MIRYLVLVVLFLSVAAQGQPVQITVVDSQSGEPVPKFEYYAVVETPDGESTGEARDWVSIENTDGVISLDLPATCKLKLSVRSRSYKYDYPRSKAYIVTADAPSRTIKHTLELGITVRGRVIDGKSGEPVAGALVSPEIFTPPGSSPDRERGVVSDAQGRFELPGVSEIFSVEHPNYIEQREGVRDAAPGDVVEREIRLEAGERLVGVVQRPDGSGIAGARVESGDGKRATTDERGRFELRGTRRTPSWDNSFFVIVQKPGFARYSEAHKEVPADGLVITLDPLFEIHGRVVAPDGTPVPDFRVVAGPGRAPQDYQSESRVVLAATDGEFSISIEYEPEANWIAVRAPGFAPFETWLPMEREREPLLVQLNPGVSVSGKVVLPAGEIVGGSARLVFDRLNEDRVLGDDSSAKLFFSEETQINADGTFRLDNIRSGLYVLHVGGTNCTGQWMMAGVDDTGLAIGDIRVLGVGAVQGVVIGEDGNPWPLKDGRVVHAALPTDDESPRGYGGIPFRTDEHGRFTVQGVPAGVAEVNVSYHLTADIVGGSSASAAVIQGGTAEVTVDCRYGGDAAPQSGTLVSGLIQVGEGSEEHWLSGTAHGAERQVGLIGSPFGNDEQEVPGITGRPPRFRMTLEPVGPGRVPEQSEEVDRGGSIKVSGVAPGRYRLALFDAPLPWRFSTPEPLFRSSVDVTQEPLEVSIRLGAGAITGRVVLPDLTPSDPTWAIARAYTVGLHGETRAAVADELGCFAFRYLDSASYECVVRHEHLGWCRFAPVGVSENIVDLGERELQPGPTVVGTIRVKSTCPVATAIRARGPSGIEFEAVTYDRRRSNYVPADFVIPSLWPGDWELRLMDKSTVLATAHFTAPLNGEVHVELEVP